MRIETRGPENGICNICGLNRKLTDDHIPPKGVPRVGQAYLMDLIEFMGAERPKKSKRLFQSGVKYRSICANCNNKRLGSDYDPELISFTTQIATQLGSRLFLPISVHSRQNRLARSVVGHLLAYGVGIHRRGKVINDLTDYFLDETAAFPSSLGLYYWLYPYNDQVATNGAAGFFDFRTQNEPMFFMLIKFFPISFLITQGELPAISYNVERLDASLTSTIDDTVDVTVNLTQIPPRRWPEAPDDNGVVMHIKGATGAIRRAP